MTHRVQRRLLSSAVIIAPILHLGILAFTLRARQMSFDELTQWVSARAADTPLGLFEVTQFHGRPPLYHLMIWPLAQLWPSPAAAKYLILSLALITSTTVAQVGWRRQSPAVNLLIFTPYLSIGYFGLVRDYALMTLLAIVCAACSPITTPRLFFGCAVGLTLTNVFGIMLSIALVVSLIFSRPRSRDDTRPRPCRLGMAITAVAVLAGLWLSRPRRDGQVLLGLQLESASISFRIRKSVLSYLGETMTGRSQDPARRIDFYEIALLLLTLVVVILVAAAAWRHGRRPVIFLMTAVLLGVANALLGYSQHWWHWGYFHVVLVMTLLMIRASDSDFRRRPNSLPKLAIVSFSLLSLAAIPWLPMTDFLFSDPPHTRAKEVATWIEVNCPEPCVPIVSSELPGDSVSAELGGRALYYVNRKDFGTYAYLTRANMVTDTSWTAISQAAEAFETYVVVIQEDAVTGIQPLTLQEAARFTDASNAWGRYVIYQPRP